MAMVSVPLRGVGCFLYYERLELSNKEFPSPCGVWVVSVPRDGVLLASEFPSPCGVWVVSGGLHETVTSFRPLAGCGLFQTNNELTYADIEVSVPLRGVGCFCAILSR